MLPLSLLALSTLAGAQETLTLTIEGTALVDAPFSICLGPDAESPCGQYFFTNDLVVVGGCARGVLVEAGDDGPLVAARVADTINTWTPCTNLGFSATAQNNQVFVSGPVPFDLAVNAFDEMGTCGGSQPNTPFDGLWLTACQVNNLGNGIPCDEAEPHTGGLSLSAADATPVFCHGDGSGSPCPCSNTGSQGDGCLNSTGSGAGLTMAGTNSSSADDLRLRASGLVPGQTALLFTGTSPVNSGLGNTLGDGLLCIGGSIVRLETRVPNPAGEATWGPGLIGAQGWAPGSTRYFQVWYRDSVGSPCGSGFNLTNGLRVIIQ